MCLCGCVTTDCRSFIHRHRAVYSKDGIIHFGGHSPRRRSELCFCLCTHGLGRSENVFTNHMNKWITLTSTLLRPSVGQELGQNGTRKRHPACSGWSTPNVDIQFSRTRSSRSTHYLLYALAKTPVRDEYKWSCPLSGLISFDLIFNNRIDVTLARIRFRTLQMGHEISKSPLVSNTFSKT